MICDDLSQFNIQICFLPWFPSQNVHPFEELIVSPCVRAAGRAYPSAFEWQNHLIRNHRVWFYCTVFFVVIESGYLHWKFFFFIRWYYFYCRVLCTYRVLLKIASQLEIFLVRKCIVNFYFLIVLFQFFIRRKSNDSLSVVFLHRKLINDYIIKFLFRLQKIHVKGLIILIRKCADGSIKNWYNYGCWKFQYYRLPITTPLVWI